MNVIFAAYSPFFSDAPYSASLILKIVLCFLAGLAMVFGLSRAPTRARRPIVAGATFLAGLFYVVWYFWPKAWDKKELDIPLNWSEGVAFWLDDAQPVVSTFANVIGAFLLGLGIYSLLRVHVGRLTKRQTNWQFSLALLLSMIAMIGLGYSDYITREIIKGGEQYDLMSGWRWWHFGYDFLFEGLLQQMDAAMFSLIAFYILSAAYRAFRIRSVESTILLSAALIMMLSLMGAVDYLWSSGVDNLTGANPGHFLNNFKINVLADWVKANIQVSSLRAVDFGIGIGTLAMGLRLWLSLEKGGIGA